LAEKIPREEQGEETKLLKVHPSQQRPSCKQGDRIKTKEPVLARSSGSKPFMRGGSAQIAV